MSSVFPGRTETEIQLAIEAATCEPDNQLDMDIIISMLGEVDTSQEICIETWQAKMKQIGKQRIQVDRIEKDFMQQAIAQYKKGINLYRKPHVEFTNEVGQDEGALTIEFFTLIIDGLLGEVEPGTCLFEGEVGYLVPTIARTAQDYFRIAGRIIGHSLLHANRGIPFISRAILHCLVHMTTSSGLPKDNPVPITIEDVPDTEVRMKIKKVSSYIY